MREMLLESIRSAAPYDLIVIGGGANGAGIALDAATRGLSTVLFERDEFASGTSSRSSKLIHGGVRYLAHGAFGLVREALRERAVLLAHAPALVRPLRFLLPSYRWTDSVKYRLGLTLYDGLAGGRGLAGSAPLDHTATRSLVPTLKATGLRGAMAYDDAAFDDARLVMTLLARARDHGARTLNHAEVIAVERRSGGQGVGVVVREQTSGREFSLAARMIINAAGPWGDAVRRLGGAAETTLTPSRGSHVVINAQLTGTNHALVFPRTPDGRIMFAVPWHDRTLIGTTDVAATASDDRVLPAAEEIDAILEVAGHFLDPAPGRDDVVSVFAGLRPLAGVPDGSTTARRSREHALDVDASGMVSVSGGKWTTYRLIAEQAVDLALADAGMSAGPCRTAGFDLAPRLPGVGEAFAPWGHAAHTLAQLSLATADLQAPLDPALPYCGAHYLHAARYEGAQTLFGALAFHTRALFIDAAAAVAVAPRVAQILATELGRDDTWIASELATLRRRAVEFTLPQR